MFRLMSAAGLLACGRLRWALRWSKRMIRNFSGSSVVRLRAEHPDPGPPCTIRAGTPSGFPQVSQYTRFPSPVSSIPVWSGSMSGYVGMQKILGKPGRPFGHSPFRPPAVGAPKRRTSPLPPHRLQ